MAVIVNQASHCFRFEKDFTSNWRCIPLCVRRKLDLIGLKLKLSHWLSLSQQQRQELVDWPDDQQALSHLCKHLQDWTRLMPDGVATSLRPAASQPWQLPAHLPLSLSKAATQRGIVLAPSQWAGMTELERFALFKLARPGHDHHNLEAAFGEVLYEPNK